MGMEVPATVPGPGSLPTATDDMRLRILQAATGCDYDDLQELALALGDTFTYSPDGPRRDPEAQPAVYWRDRETQGDPILERLVLLLQARWTSFVETFQPEPAVEIEVTMHVWPSVWDADDPDADDPDQWRALQRVYRPADVSEWRSKKVYGGERVVITDEGRWTEFAPVGEVHP